MKLELDLGSGTRVGKLDFSKAPCRIGERTGSHVGLFSMFLCTQNCLLDKAVYHYKTRMICIAALQIIVSV